MRQLVAIDKPIIPMDREWKRVKKRSQVVPVATRQLARYKKMQAQLALVPEVAVNDRATKARATLAQFIELQINGYADLLKGIETGDTALIEQADNETKASSPLFDQYLDIYALSPCF